MPRGVGCLLLLLHAGQCVGCLGLGESLRSMKFPHPREEGRIIRDAMGYKLRDACQTKTFFTAQNSTSDYPSLPPNTGGKGVSRMARSQIRKGSQSVANRFSPQFQEMVDVQTLVLI